MKAKKTVYLTKPRGFCAGVNRAILTVELALKKFGAPIYVRHQIVHNNYVVEDLMNQGAVFVEDMDSIPEGSIVVLSAHGVPPSVYDSVKERNLVKIDATCPLVTKVHLEAIHFQKSGYKIILIGHRGHQEVIGTMGYGDMILVETLEDVKLLDIDEKEEKIVYLTQTTLSVDDTYEIISALKNRYKNIVSAPMEDICYASQNRQNAVKNLVKYVDVVLVVGAINSSNSNRLVETAKRYGCESFLISDLENIDDSSFLQYENIGITSGASVPDRLVDLLVKHIELIAKVEIKNIDVINEKMIFPVPREVN